MCGVGVLGVLGTLLDLVFGVFHELREVFHNGVPWMKIANITCFYGLKCMIKVLDKTAIDSKINGICAMFYWIYHTLYPTLFSFTNTFITQL